MFEFLRRHRGVLGVFAALALVLAACGDDDDETSTAEPTEDAEDDTTTDNGDDTDSDDEAEGETVEVTAVDYAFEGLPDSIPAGSSIELTNESEVEVHEFVAIRLPDDEDRSIEELLQLPPEELTQVGTPSDVIVAPPGQAGMAVEGDGVLDEPGRYVIICAIPTGADPQEFLEAAQESEGGPPDVEGGPPHLAEGMFAEVTVEADG